MSKQPEQIDYKSSGVDIEAGNEAVRRMKSHVAKTHTSAVLTGLGIPLETPITNAKLLEG